jgi:hypothetical protein
VSGLEDEIDYKRKEQIHDNVVDMIMRTVQYILISRRAKI